MIRVKFTAIGAFFLFFLSLQAAAETAATPFSTLKFNGERATDYFLLRDNSTGVLMSGGRRMSRWTIKPVTSTQTDISWSSPDVQKGSPPEPPKVEEWSIRRNCMDGRSFLWLDAYRSDIGIADKSPRFRIGARRTEFRGVDGEWVKLDTSGCGAGGHLYALYDVTTDAYGIRVWGDIYMADGVTVGRRFFWQANLAYAPNVENPCRRSPDRARPGLRLDEAWWDNVNGWSIGSGDMLDAEPSGANVIYGRWGIIAKGGGPGWVGGWGNRPKESFCLIEE
jgi:hypothetical protein